MILAQLTAGGSGALCFGSSTVSDRFDDLVLEPLTLILMAFFTQTSPEAVAVELSAYLLLVVVVFLVLQRLLNKLFPDH